MNIERARLIQKEPTPREIASKQKKERIFRTAVDLFTKYGYDKVTIKDIASGSGMSEGSIYNFFGSKAGILSCLNDYAIDHAYSSIVPSQEHLENPYETIYNYCLHVAEAYDEYGPELIRVNLCHIIPQNRVPKSHDSILNSLNSLNPNLFDFVSHAQEIKTISNRHSADELTFSLMNIMNGLVSIWARYDDTFTLCTICERTLPFLLRDVL